MKETLRDMLSNQLRDVEEYAYHFEQSQNCMENQIVWESRQDDLKHLNLNALVFYGAQRNLNEFPSCVIWKRVHNFQLGIESYQFKINLTAPILIFPSIEECNPFSIIDKPTTSLIYLNSKNEKRFMNLEELSKFCDATLKRPQDNESIRKRDHEVSKASRADEKMGVICEWKTNSTDDEALVIINP
ncbi:hypothetical protein Tco_1440251 [Tanacetum coccineum]